MRLSVLQKVGRNILLGIIALALAPFIFALALILLPILIFSVVILRDQKSDTLLKATRAIKQDEEQSRWDALCEVQLNFSSVHELQEKLRDESTPIEKMARQVSNALNGNLEEVRKKIQEIYRKDKPVEAILFETGYKIPNIKSISKRISSELKTDENSAEELNDALIKIGTHLAVEKPHDLTKANRVLTQLLRQALQTEAYQALKEDPNDYTIKTLQTLAFSLWNDTQVMDAYVNLGSKILDTVAFAEIEKSMTGHDVVKVLTDSSRAAKSQLFRDKTLLGKINYFFEHPMHALQALASEEGILGKIASWAGHSPYESHLLVSNQPWIQGKTTAHYQGQLITIQNCYGGSSIVADEISPEFLAMLQGIENNHFAEYPDLTIPSVITYTNFQDLHQEEENVRSIAIMQLNQQFPIVFFGITLSKDSRFYKNKDEADWSGSEMFGREMKSALMHGSAFSLVGRVGANKEDAGFYFPGDHDKWKPVFDVIIKKANERFKDVPDELKLHDRSSDLRGAYQEYVYIMLQAYIEMALGKDQIERFGVKNPIVMAIRASGENIDRAGVANVSYLYTRLENDYFDGDKKEEGMKMLDAMFYGRALAVHNRLVYMDRTLETFSFMKYVDRQGFRKDLEDVLNTMGITGMVYKPSPITL